MYTTYSTNIQFLIKISTLHYSEMKQMLACSTAA